MTPLSVEFTLLNVISFLQKIKVTKMFLNSVLKAGWGGRGGSQILDARGGREFQMRTACNRGVGGGGV